MDIGTGIAIAGVWIFAGMFGMSSTTSSFGVWLGIICAGVVTAALV